MGRGRQLTTGRFETRQELEAYVDHLWLDSNADQATIARACRISQATASKIISRKQQARILQLNRAAPALLRAARLVLVAFEHAPGEGPEWYETTRHAVEIATRDRSPGCSS